MARRASIKHPPRRRYDSPRRTGGALQTRRRIRSAASELFLRDGYARASMRAIAASAGVAEKTVYLAFATKASILNEIIRVAIRGDAGPAGPTRGLAGDARRPH